MYGAKDAVAQLAGTLPQRAVVPCFVRGASACLRPRVCSACLLCVAVWEERSNHIRSCVRCELLAVRAQEPWRVCRLGDVTYTRFAQLGLRLRGSVRFEVRGRRVCRLRCYVCVRVCACVVSCCPACFCNRFIIYIICKSGGYIIAPKSHLTAKTE